MSNNRDARRVVKWPILALLRRIAKVGRWLRDNGRNPAGATDILRTRAASADRSRWRRWYKANKKHQRRMRAIRQNGGRVGNMPSSLPMYAVP